MKIIAVTGSAGTGKTMYAKKLARTRGFLYFDSTQFIKDYKVYTAYDRSLQTYVVDTKIFVAVLTDVLQGFVKEGWKGVVVDGHLTHYLPKKLVDHVVVVRCDVKTLRKRLTKRKYSAKKIETNVEAEIMETCLIEAEEQGHTINIVEGKGLNKRIQRKNI